MKYGSVPRYCNGVGRANFMTNVRQFILVKDRRATLSEYHTRVVLRLVHTHSGEVCDIRSSRY